MRGRQFPTIAQLGRTAEGNPRASAARLRWTELGAKQVGIVQSLIVTCRLHGIDFYTYLVDVLQRVGEHPASRVAELTPRPPTHCARLCTASLHKMCRYLEHGP